VKNFDSETFKKAFGLDGDGSTIYACAAQAGKSAWASSSETLSPLTASIAAICEDSIKLKKKFNNDFVRVVQDAAGFRGECILHGHIFPLKLVSNDDQDDDLNHEDIKSTSTLKETATINTYETAGVTMNAGSITAVIQNHQNAVE